MSTIKIYGVSCESNQLANLLGLPDLLCIATGPAGWRERSYTSTAARQTAKREGWKRVKHQARYSVLVYDVCPACCPVLEPALKAVQS